MIRRPKHADNPTASQARVILMAFMLAICFRLAPVAHLFKNTKLDATSPRPSPPKAERETGATGFIIITSRFTSYAARIFSSKSLLSTASLIWTQISSTTPSQGA